MIKAITDAKEWQWAQTVSLQPTLPLPPSSLKPSCPTSDRLFVVCTTDGAWRKDLKAAGLGWTTSLPSGISSQHSAVCENVSSPLMAESLACRAAIMDAVSSGATHLLLESDCSQLVGAINSRSAILEIHGIISDIFLSINSFSNFICRFIPRSANVIADGLAKHCLSVFGQNTV